MQSLQSILASLADALLYPVVIGLLAAIAFALVSLGSFAREALTRKANEVRRLAQFAQLHRTDLAAASQQFARLECARGRTVDRGALVSRLAPMFGLAGTLIPLGPGLRELHAGNIEGLGAQLGVAFSTTVAGLAASSVCYAIAGVRSRWYENELRELESVQAEVGS